MYNLFYFYILQWFVKFGIYAPNKVDVNFITYWSLVEWWSWHRSWEAKYRKNSRTDNFNTKTTWFKDRLFLDGFSISFCVDNETTQIFKLFSMVPILFLISRCLVGSNRTVKGLIFQNVALFNEITRLNVYCLCFFDVQQNKYFLWRVGHTFCKM